MVCLPEGVSGWGHLRDVFEWVALNLFDGGPGKGPEQLVLQPPYQSNVVVAAAISDSCLVPLLKERPGGDGDEMKGGQK